LPAHLEYILFNFLVLAGPIAFSFDGKLQFFRHWRRAGLSALAMMPAFILWDSLVTGRHWWFNPLYTAGTYIGVLPLGEWLFFLTVPFASVFVWEVLRHYRPQGWAIRNPMTPWWLLFILVPAALFLLLGKEYTALVILALSVIAILDLYRGGQILARPNSWWYAAILTGLMLIFNGYLTARPVVLYDPAYQLDMRIWTIPVEDFLYGFSLILGCTSIYEKYR
jgi:lycopene cyclase domain-containing protein